MSYLSTLFGYDIPEDVKIFNLEVVTLLGVNKTKYTMDHGICFLMKNYKDYKKKNTRNSLIGTYFLIYPLASRDKNSKNAF